MNKLNSLKLGVSAAIGLMTVASIAQASTTILINKKMDSRDIEFFKYRWTRTRGRRLRT
jgi:hypothetical protein